jgi:hypothetical protein
MDFSGMFVLDGPAVVFPLFSQNEFERFLHPGIIAFFVDLIRA